MKKILCILLASCVFFTNLYIPSAAEKTLGEIKEDLANYKQEYEDNKLQTELSEQEKIEAENRIYQIKARMFEIEEEIQKLNIEIETLNKEIELLNLEIEKNEKEIEDILIFTQVQNGESAYLEYAFGAQDFTDFIYRIAVSEQITTYNDQLIDTHKSNIETNKLKTEEMAKKTEELADTKVSLTKEQSNLEVEIKKIEASLQSLESEALSIEELIKAKEQEIKIFETNGCTDDQTLKQCQISILPEDTSFWRPITKGVVTSEYGNRACGGEVSCFHNGIDLSLSGASSGNVPIYSAASGIVVYTTNFSGYTCSPKRVYIQHNVNGTIYTTGYLHMHTLNVSVGDYVSKDTVIGTMGGYEPQDTCSTGAHLHFEISDGSFSGSSVTHYSKRFNPRMLINFPAYKQTYWYDRITKY